jgi:hypothetical protein
MAQYLRTVSDLREAAWGAGNRTSSPIKIFDDTMAKAV